jgi:hypothetical protein
MVRSLALIVSSLLFVGTARADLQLSPKIVEYELDGVKFKHLAFSDGSGKEITYAPPRGWELSGNASQLSLYPPNKSHAEAIISKVSLPHSESFDDETIRRLVDEALVSVPKSSTDVRLTSEEKSPLKIQRKETLLLILTYNLYGQSCSRSILFLNRDKEQIRFELTCRQADFNELHKAFLGSQYSWHNL